MTNVTKIIAIAANSNSSAVSDDGELWKRLGVPEEGQWVDGIYANSIHVAIHTHSRSAFSVDGITWRESSLPYLQPVDYYDGTPDIPLTFEPRSYRPFWTSIAYGYGRFVAVANGTDTYAISTDGINWTERKLPTSGRFCQIIYGGGKFLVVNRSSKTILTSDDGLTWGSLMVDPQVGGTVYPADYSSIAYGKGIYVLTCNGHDSFVMRSTNLSSWDGHKINQDAIDSKVVYCNSEFVIFSNGRTQLQLSQGETFEEGVTKDYKNISEWLPRDDQSGLFWKASPNFTSSDGITWKRAPVGLPANQVSARYNAGKLEAVVPGTDTVFISEDSVKTESANFFWQDVTVDEVSGSKHYSAGVGMMSGSKINQQATSTGPIERKSWKISLTLVSRNKVSDHDQSDYFWENGNFTTTLKPVRGITTAYKVFNSRTESGGMGSVNLQAVRKVSGTTTIGFDWKKRPLNEISNWTSIWYGDGKWMALSGNEIVAESLDNGETWKSYLLPVRNTWNFSSGSATTYISSIKDWKKPNSTVAYSATNLLTWHGGVLPVKLEPCIVAVANNQNNLYTSYNGTDFRTISL